MIQINYKLKDAGWAIGGVGNKNELIEFEVSYLNDSLKQLAESAIQIHSKSHLTIVFMSEPVEHILKLKKNNKHQIEYELRWYEDWFSWNLVAEDNYTLKLDGITSIAKYQNQVRKILKDIYESIGVEGYKKRWVEHDFPISEYNLLK